MTLDLTPFFETWNTGIEIATYLSAHDAEAKLSEDFFKKVFEETRANLEHTFAKIWNETPKFIYVVSENHNLTPEVHPYFGSTEVYNDPTDRISYLTVTVAPVTNPLSSPIYHVTAIHSTATLNNFTGSTPLVIEDVEMYNAHWATTRELPPVITI